MTTCNFPVNHTKSMMFIFVTSFMQPVIRHSFVSFLRNAKPMVSASVRRITYTYMDDMYFNKICPQNKGLPVIPGISYRHGCYFIHESYVWSFSKLCWRLEISGLFIRELNWRAYSGRLGQVKAKTLWALFHCMQVCTHTCIHVHYM